MKKLILLNLLISTLFYSQLIPSDVKNLINSNSGEIASYRVVTKYFDGSEMDSKKVDNFIYFKNADKYYVLNEFLLGKPLSVALFGAVPDDGIDDTNAIQIAAKYKNISFADGIYQINNRIVLNNFVSFVGSANTTIKLSNQSNTGMFLLKDNESVFIKNIKFDGNREGQLFSNTDPLDLSENRSIFRLENSKNIIFDNCIFTMSQGDAISLDADYSAVRTVENMNRDILIKNNVFNNNGRNGISAIHCVDVDITDNLFENHNALGSALGSGVDLEPNPGIFQNDNYIVKNVNINNNKFYGNNYGVMLFRSLIASTNVYGGTVTDVFLNSNTFFNNDFDDFTIFNIKGRVIFTNNKVVGWAKSTDGYRASVSVINSTGNINITNNTLSSSLPFVLTSSSYVNFSSNIVNFKDYGLFLKIDPYYDFTILVQFNNFTNNIFTEKLDDAKTFGESYFVKLLNVNGLSAIENNLFKNNLYSTENIYGENSFISIVSNIANNNSIKKNYFVNESTNKTVANSVIQTVNNIPSDNHLINLINY